MGLFIGDVEPSKIFVGDSEVSKVFVGDTQVRPTGTTLTYDFTQSDNGFTIHTDGYSQGQYIQGTGFRFTNNGGYRGGTLIPPQNIFNNETLKRITLYFNRANNNCACGIKDTATDYVYRYISELNRPSNVGTYTSDMTVGAFSGDIVHRMEFSGTNILGNINGTDYTFDATRAEIPNIPNAWTNKTLVFLYNLRGRMGPIIIQKVEFETK